MKPGARVQGVANHGHAAGYQTCNPYPDYAEDIELLVEAEKLHFKPNFLGSLIEPEAGPPAP